MIINDDYFNGNKKDEPPIQKSDVKQEKIPVSREPDAKADMKKVDELKTNMKQNPITESKTPDVKPN